MTAPAAYRAAVLGLARAALAAGVREHGAPNRGPEIDRYLSGCVRGGRRLGVLGVPWCAAFASWCLWEAWDVDPLPEPPVYWWQEPFIAALWWPDQRDHPDPPVVGYRAAVSELVQDAKAVGAWRDVATGYAPLPGDLCVMGRGGHDPRSGGEGHVGIVEAWDGLLDGWACLGGNEGNRVARSTRRMMDKVEPIVGFVCIA